MSDLNDTRAAIDNSRLMTKLAIVGLVISLGLLVLDVTATALRGVNYCTDVFALAAIPYSLAVLFSLAAMIHGILGSAAAAEDEEKQLLENRKATNALSVEEDVRFTAGRSLENFRRYSPYVFAVLGAASVGLLLWLTAAGWRERVPVADASLNALQFAIISFIMMLVSGFLGAFLAGQSHQGAFRWLRPAGAWLIAAFAVMLLATVSAIFTRSNNLAADGYIAKVLFWVFAVLGAEFITSFVIEFYRPRTLGEDRPVFESRLLALFTEPGGVMRNIASALDYQFGFKVSGTWLYSFVERSFFPMVILFALIFWGSTMIYEVGPSQVGVRETLGRVTGENLKPGIYWTLPYPFGQVRLFSCTELRQVVVGELRSGTDDDGAEPVKQETGLSQVVLWTVAHGGADNNFLVAVPPEDGKVDTGGASISFIRMVIPIQYRIRPDGVMNFAYNNADPVRTLRRIGAQAATEYLASSSMMAVMSTRRSETESALRERIQSLADAHTLGVDVVKVSILDAHPPVEKVAPAYQNVIGAMETMETTILKAESYAAKTVPDAQAQAAGIVADAESYRYTIRKVSKAESERFLTQVITYNAMPAMFKLRSYLDFLENDCRGVRKFVVSSSLNNEVYELNFEAKERLDLIDTDLTQIDKQ
ncbi:MAG: protease modulator HflK [Victivallaceae bacterium]|nr:protease modulator HflK [Victivallaceae bacterium]